MGVRDRDLTLSEEYQQASFDILEEQPEDSSSLVTSAQEFAALDVRPPRRSLPRDEENVDLYTAVSVSSRPEGEQHESEERYRAIFENANDAIAFIALDGTITSVNRKAESLTGLPREQIIGRSFADFLTPSSTALGAERLQRALAGEQLPSTFEVELIQAQGPTIPVEARTRFLRNQNGILTGFLGIYRDITERKRAEEDLRRAHAELEQRVHERTIDLARANDALRAEISERKRAEETARAAEREYRTIFENAVEGIYRSSLDGRQLRANPALVKLNGYESEEEMLPAVNNIATEWYVDPHRRDEFQQVLEKYGVVENFESEIYRHKTRERIWICETARLVRDQHGLPLYYEGTVQDITARKHAEIALQKNHLELEQRVQERTATLTQVNQALQAEIEERKRIERALRDSEERYRDLFENANDAIGTAAPDSTLLSINRRVEDILGYAREEVLGKRLVDFATPAARALIEERWHRIRSGEFVSPTVELELVRKDNSMVSVEGRVRPLFDPNGQLIGLHGIYRDITERKKVEKMKDELISTVSHELRTPLASLRGFAELMLQRQFPTDQQREFLSIIHDEAVRLSRLIDDFLDLQRLESGHQPYTFVPFALEPLLHESIELFTTIGGRHPFSVDMKLPLPLVCGDASRIRQVVVNLISNAIKFSPHGGTVEVGARAEQQEVIVWVKDRGVGIPQEAVAKLFTRFFRVDNSDTRNIGGTGLGLALVREIINAHHGRVWVESTAGVGSIFFFTLMSAAENL